LAQIYAESFVEWALPQTQLGELEALPRPPDGLGVGMPGKMDGWAGVKEGGEGRDGREGEGMGESPRMPKCRVGKHTCQ